MNTTTAPDTTGNDAPESTLDDRRIVRTKYAGVFFADVAALDLAAGTATLVNARRLWYWAGAASLSQLAVEGTSRPEDCKFPVAMPEVDVAEVIEVIYVTRPAAASIDSVPVWKA